SRPRTRATSRATPRTRASRATNPTEREHRETSRFPRLPATKEVSIGPGVGGGGALDRAPLCLRSRKHEMSHVVLRLRLAKRALTAGFALLGFAACSGSSSVDLTPPSPDGGSLPDAAPGVAPTDAATPPDSGGTQVPGDAGCVATEKS